MTAALMGLGVSLAYGLSNFMGPVLGRRFGSMTVLLISQALATSVAGVLVLISGDAGLSGSALAYALLAGVANLIAVTSLYRAAMIGPMSLVMPINACGSVVPAIWAEAHGRPLPWHSVLAIVMVLGGAMLAARHRAPAVVTAPVAAPSRHPHELAADFEGPHRVEDLPGPRIRMTIVLAVLSALGYGVMLLALPEAANGSTWWAIFDSRVVLLVTLAAGMFLFARAELVRPPIRSIPMLALPGLLLLIGSVLYIGAANVGDLSIVAVLSSLYPLITVALAILVLRERPSIVQRVGIATAIAGTVLLAV